MNSVLVVDTAAANQDLTSLANVKAELGIATTAEDVNIAEWINQASDSIANFCNRVFGSETVTQTFRNRVYGFEPAKLVLDRSPVTAISSVVEDGTTLASTDYEYDPQSGIMTRLCGDYERRWSFRKLIVSYTAGYTLLSTLPDSIERAAISLVKTYRSAATRDPLLKSEEIPGVLSQTFWVGGVGDKSNGIPHDIETMIAPYRNIAI